MRKIKKTQKKNFSLKRWLYRLWIAFWALVFVSLLGFGIWSFESGIAAQKWGAFKNAFHQTLGSAGFKLQDILITGRVRTPMADVKNALHIPENNLITAMDMERMQKALTQLPWVKEATVARQLPDILYIELVERKPIALWQRNKQHFPLDETGKVVEATCDECPYLPVVVGEKAPKYTPAFIAKLEKHEELYTRTLSAVLIDGRRWNLYIDDIDNGIVVLLPDMDLNAALERLALLQKEHGVLDKKIKKLDLRFADKVIIEPIGKDAVTLPLNNGGKKP